MLKTEVHYGEMLAVNLQNFCQASCPGKLYLGSGNFCFVIFSDGQFWVTCHPSSTLVEKKSFKTIVMDPPLCISQPFSLHSFKYLYLCFLKTCWLQNLQVFNLSGIRVFCLTVWEITEKGSSFPEIFYYVRSMLSINLQTFPLTKTLFLTGMYFFSGP